MRYWDRAATKKTESNDPDYTVGIKLEKDKNNILYVTDIVRIAAEPSWCAKCYQEYCYPRRPFGKDWSRAGSWSGWSERSGLSCENASRI